MPTVAFVGTRQDLRRRLRALPRILAGGAPDPYGLARGLQLRLGVALLSKVQQDFVTKSRGGTGEDGIKWPALQRSTIAQRRTTRQERKALGITGRRTRGLLTPAQDRRWKQIFASRRNALMAKHGMGSGQASAIAAKIAWSILKSEGAQTKLALLGGRRVDILRDTGELFRSLGPGVEDRPSGADGQVFDVPPGKVIVGTNKKTWHHRGVPGKLPARPLWRLDGTLPPGWWQYLLRVYNRGLVRALVLIL